MRSLITFNKPDASHFTNTEDNPGVCYTTSPITISTERKSLTNRFVKIITADAYTPNSRAALTESRPVKKERKGWLSSMANKFSNLKLGEKDVDPPLSTPAGKRHKSTYAQLVNETDKVAARWELNAFYFSHMYQVYQIIPHLDENELESHHLVKYEMFYGQFEVCIVGKFIPGWNPSIQACQADSIIVKALVIALRYLFTCKLFLRVISIGCCFLRVCLLTIANSLKSSEALTL